MPAEVLLCERADQRLLELRAYYLSKRASTWEKLAIKIFNGFDTIAAHNYIGEKVSGLPEKYRRLTVTPFGGRSTSSSTTSFVIYYRIDDPGKLVRIIDIRSGAQKSLQPQSLKRYSQKLIDRENQEE